MKFGLRRMRTCRDRTEAKHASDRCSDKNSCFLPRAHSAIVLQMDGYAVLRRLATFPVEIDSHVTLVERIEGTMKNCRLPEAARPNVMYYIPGGWAIPAVGVLGILIASICSLAATGFGGLAAPIVGFILGAGCMAGLGWELATHGGFEAAALFPVSLLLSVPSGIGGAIAGWLNRRTPRHIQKS